MLRRTKILSSISFALAMLTLLVFAVLPHHHHGVAVCVVVEHCTQSDDLHDGHNCCDDTKHNNLCITETEYIAPDNSIKCRESSCDNHSHDHAHFLPLICVFLDTILCDVDPLIHKYEYGEYLAIYKSAYVGQCNSLRAPPEII